MPLYNPDKWKLEAGAYTALTQKTNEPLFLDLGINEAAPYTIAGGVAPDANFVTDNGSSGLGATNITMVSTHGSGGADLGSLLTFNRSRGTSTSPTAIQNGDIIGGILFGGYGGGDYNLAITGLLATSISDWDASSDVNLAYQVNGNTIFDTLSTTSKTTAYSDWQFQSLLSIADGTAAAPSLNNTGNAGVGVYFPATDQFGIAAGGVSSAIFSDGTAALNFLELAPANRTLTSNYFTGYQSFINVDSTYTLSTANAIAPMCYNNASTSIFAADGFAYGSAFLFWNHMLVQNSSGSTRTIGGTGSFIDQIIVQANGGSLATQYHSGFLGGPTFNVINSGTMSSVQGANEFWSNAAAVGAGVTLPYFNHYRASPIINSGTVTYQAGFVTDSMTTATNNAGLVIGTQATGNWGIYQSTSTANYLGGALTVSGTISSPSASTNGERFGLASVVSGSNGVAFGYQASSTGGNSIAIGRAASDGGNSGAVVVGYSALAAGTNCFALGRNATAASGSIAIGYNSDASLGSSSVVLGREAVNTTSNQFIAGSTSYIIDNVFFGTGVVSTVPRDYTINGSGGSGTDIAGADLILAGGKNTGAGVGGSILFQTSPAGASSATLATLATRMTIAHTTQTYVDAYDIAFGTTTGTKIGTATTQKIGLWNATPIVQPTTAVTAATFAANTSGIADDTATFDGYTIGQIVKALRNIGALA